MALKSIAALLTAGATCGLLLANLIFARWPSPNSAIPGSDQVKAYSLSRSASGPYLSWLHPLNESVFSLQFAHWENGQWTKPKAIAQGGDWFINYADRPSVEPLPNGSFVAHWLVRNSAATGNYGYGLRVALSQDKGETWKVIYRAGLQNKSDYTGFLSFLPLPDGFGASYLAPPDHPVEGHIKTLRYVHFSFEGKVLADDLLDADVCTCCPTATALIGNEPAIAYRDHRANDVRDISFMRHEGGKWLPPQFVSQDGWELKGCPTDGPALVAQGKKVALAWFTRAKNTPEVEVAISEDSGAHFPTTIRVDDSNPVGHPDVQLLGNGAVAVSWIERHPQMKNKLCLRLIDSSGHVGTLHEIADIGAARSAGFPAIRVTQNSVLAVWSDGQMKTSLLPLDPQ